MFYQLMGKTDALFPGHKGSPPHERLHTARGAESGRAGSGFNILKLAGAATESVAPGDLLIVETTLP
jgi:hypothetical protein